MLLKNMIHTLKAYQYRGVFALVFAMSSIAVMGADKFVVCMAWTPHVDFTGYYVAKEKGFYKDAGLDVQIEHPLLTTSTYEKVFDQEGGCDAGVFSLMTAMATIADGRPLVNVFQTSMNSSYMLVSSKGQNPLTQKGARMGVYMSETNYLTYILDRKYNLNYEYVFFASGINVFLSKAVDVASMVSYWEVLQLKEAGFKMPEHTVYRFADNGYNIQENGVYVKKEYYDAHRTQMKRFAEASRRGWEWTAAHPEQALDIAMKYLRMNRERSNRTIQTLMLKEVLRLQTNMETGKREYRLRPDMVRLANRLMRDARMLNRDVTYEELIGKKEQVAIPRPWITE